MEPMPTIVRPSSVWYRGRRANIAFGAVIMPIRGRAVTSLPTTCRLAVPNSTPTSGRAIGAAIGAMPPSVTACTNGRGMMITTAGGRGTGIPVKGLAPGSGPTCVPSVGCISSTCTSMSQRTKPCSIPHASPPCWFSGCVRGTSQRTLVTHEPTYFRPKRRAPSNVTSPSMPGHTSLP
jgi:hypothetical protein